MRPGRAVVDTTVNLAIRGLLTPPPTLDAPALPADHDQSPAGSQQDPDAVGELVDEHLDDDENPDAVHELHERLIEIRRALDDLGAVTSELDAVRGRKEAERILTDLLEEIGQLPTRSPPRSPPKTPNSSTPTTSTAARFAQSPVAPRARHGNANPA